MCNKYDVPVSKHLDDGKSFTNQLINSDKLL